MTDSTKAAPEMASSPASYPASTEMASPGCYCGDCCVGVQGYPLCTCMYRGCCHGDDPYLSLALQEKLANEGKTVWFLYPSHHFFGKSSTYNRPPWALEGHGMGFWSGSSRDTYDDRLAAFGVSKERYNAQQKQIEKIWQETCPSNCAWSCMQFMGTLFGTLTVGLCAFWCCCADKKAMNWIQPTAKYLEEDRKNWADTKVQWGCGWREYSRSAENPAWIPAVWLIVDGKVPPREHKGGGLGGLFGHRHMEPEVKVVVVQQPAQPDPSAPPPAYDGVNPGGGSGGNSSSSSGGGGFCGQCGKPRETQNGEPMAFCMSCGFKYPK